MRLYSAHLKADAEPLLVREGFSWGALLFGPLWLAAHRAWTAAAISLAAGILIWTVVPPPVSLVLAGAMAWVLGLTGQDLRRWAIQQRGYLLEHMVAARGSEEALQRLFTCRPELAARSMQAARC